MPPTRRTLNQMCSALVVAVIGCTAPSSENPDALGPSSGPLLAKPNTGPAYFSDLPDWSGSLIVAGVYDLGSGLPFPGEPIQSCSANREIRLVAPAGMPGSFALPAVCPSSGDNKVQLPGDPLSGDQDPYGDPVPSYAIKGNTWKPTGWMRPTLNYYWQGCTAGSGCNFVWTDGKVTVQRNGSGAIIGSTITGHCAKLYTMDTLPLYPSAGAPSCVSRDKAGTPVPGFPVELNVVLTKN